jgi:sortase (surface protein transpeptidase)
MKIEKYNIARADKYNDKEGNEKTKWDTVGTITAFHKDDGTVSQIVEIPAIGLKASVFKQEPRDKKGNSEPEGY